MGPRLTQKHGCPRREVLGLSVGLACDDAEGQPAAHSKSGQDLVAYPLCRGRRLAERIYEPRSNTSPATGPNHERGVVAKLGDQEASQGRADGAADEQREVAEARLAGGDAGDDLEVDGYVVEQEAEGTLVEEAEPHAHPDTSLPHEARHEEGVIPLQILRDHKCHSSDARAHKQPNNLARAPGPVDARDLNRAREADQRGEHEHDAHGVHVRDFLPQRGLCQRAGGRGPEQEQDHGGGGGRDGEVDVEAPAPCRRLGQRAAEDGPHDAREAVDRVDEAREDGPEPRPHRHAQDRVAACCDPGCGCAEDCAGEDQDCAVWGEACEEMCLVSFSVM